MDARHAHDEAPHVGPWYAGAVSAELLAVVRRERLERQRRRRQQRPASLTPAVARVADLLRTGLAEKEVAARIGVSRHTVHDHVKVLYRFAGVTTRAELMAWFARQ